VPAAPRLGKSPRTVTLDLPSRVVKSPTASSTLPFAGREPGGARPYATKFAIGVVHSVKTRYVSNVFSVITPPSSAEAGLVPVLPTHASNPTQRDRKDLPVLG